jgi:hypothetical protein
MDSSQEERRYDNRKELLIHYLKELHKSNKPVTFSDLLLNNLPGGGIQEFESAMAELEKKGWMNKTEQDGGTVTGLPFYRTIDRRFSISIEGVEYLASLGIIEDKHQIKKETEKSKHEIHNFGNMILGDNPQGIIQGSDLGNSRFNNNSTSREPTDIKPEPIQDAITILRNKESIWSKIYKWTDHKTVSGILLIILGFLFSRLITWLGWF